MSINVLRPSDQVHKISDVRGCGRKVGRLGVRIGVRMFSMEDRRRAVDLYFTEGMTIRKVVAKLGYPSEGALAKWLREDPRYTGACRRSYTLECNVFCQVGVGRFGVSFSPCERRVSGRFGVGRSCWLLVIALVIA